MAGGTDLRARSPIGIADLLARVARATQAAAGSSAIRAATPAAGPDLAFTLRTRLAVRGWIPPHALSETGDDPAAFRTAIDRVASEVETSWSDHPGAWYLTTAARRRVLAARDLATLSHELRIDRDAGDATDPILTAFRFLTGVRPLPPVETLSDDVLRALLLVEDWLGGKVQVRAPTQTIAAQIVRHAQDRDIARMTEFPLVGGAHRAAYEVLKARLGAPPRGGISATYISGLGGSGKSTLLAFLERSFAPASSVAVMIRLDFDDPLVNPLDPASLDLALLSRLAANDPAKADEFAGLSAALQQHRLIQTRDPGSRAAAARQAGKVQFERQQISESADFESLSTRSASERDSMLYGLLARVLGNRALVLVLDTAELVVTLGDAAMIELTYWLQSLVGSMDAHELRLLVAGRDPPDAPGAGELIRRLAGIAVMTAPIALPELSIEEAAQLLANCGVNDPVVARAAAAAVPRNPLLLRLTADALQGAPDLARDVHEAHRQAQVDLPTARRYLTRRILAHLADPVARPYLFAAMQLPTVTRAQLRGIAIPIIDALDDGASRALTERVFAALKRARWLTRASVDGRILTFHRDLRLLVRELLRADPDELARERQLRERAIRFHEARRTSRDRAYAFYHRALLGQPLGPPRRDPALALELGDVLDDLPPRARDLLAGRVPPDRLIEPAPESIDEWRRRLEGDGRNDGEGDKLLKRDRAAEALDLYRSRPTREPGLPPTFVIRALADLARWDTGEVDAEAILGESRQWFETRRLSGAAMSRIYWLTRFELVANGATLSERHIDILAECCRRVSGASLTTMPAIVAVAEAGAGRPIMTDRMRGGRGAIESETRVHLVNAIRTKAPLDFRPHLDALMVIQRDWSAQLRRRAASMLPPKGLDWAQQAIDDLDGKPIAALNPMLRSFREGIRITWDARDLAAGVLVLRGPTNEFLRPLRHVLAELLATPATQTATMATIEQVVSRMSIRPAEFAPAALRDRIARDPSAWCAAFVGFADRCRLLPLLCRLLQAGPDNAPAAVGARRVAASFLSWDEAIGGGTTSEWG